MPKTFHWTQPGIDPEHPPRRLRDHPVGVATREDRLSRFLSVSGSGVFMRGYSISGTIQNSSTGSN